MWKMYLSSYSYITDESIYVFFSLFQNSVVNLWNKTKYAYANPPNGGGGGKGGGLDVVGFVKKIFVPNLIAQINRRNQPIFIFVKCYSKFKLFCNQKKTKKKTKMTNLTRNSKNNIGGRLFLHLRIGTIGIAPSRNCWKERPPPYRQIKV